MNRAGVEHIPVPRKDDTDVSFLFSTGEEVKKAKPKSSFFVSSDCEDEEEEEEMSDDKEEEEEEEEDLSPVNRGNKQTW